MRSIGLAMAEAQLSALLDAVEAGEEVMITRCGRPVARVVREHPASGVKQDWVGRLRALHDPHESPAGSAEDLLRELRDQQP